MKYAMKPSSRFVDVKGSNKLVFFKDEKSIFDFFHTKMEQDLCNPIVRTERRENYQSRKQPNAIAATDITSIYSTLITSEVDFQFLSWAARVNKFLRKNNLKLSDSPYGYWKYTCRMRSLPCNWTVYTLVDNEDGTSNMRQMGWGEFFRNCKANNLLEGVDISYKIPEKINVEL